MLKVKAYATIIVIAVVVGAFYFLNPHQNNGHVKEEGNTVEITVTYSPTEGRKVLGIVSVGAISAPYDIDHSPYNFQPFPANRGWRIEIVVRQTSPGTMSCRIKINGQERAHDMTDILRPNRVSCLTTV